MEKLFLNKNEFSKEIEYTVREYKISYMDAILKLCEDKNLEVELVGKHINGVIKNRLEAEAQELNYLPTSNKLPGF